MNNKSLIILLMLCGLLSAEYSLKLSDDFTLRLGADNRSRWEFFDRAVPSPDLSGEPHPANQYLRLRTRAWLALDVQDTFTFNLRLGNRTHFVSSSPADPNNQGTSTWKFPDETYVDALNIVFKLDDDITFTLGRQAMSFGNGMIFADPTPFDQGRSAYTDGLRIDYQKDQDKLSLFVTYDPWKDYSVFINDQNRRLRSGDVFTAGLYWTHTMSDSFSFDAYYLFNDVNDRQPLTAERNHPADCSTSLHTAGLRAFGHPSSLFDYSVELAAQGGRDSEANACEGKMADGRLNFNLPFLEDFSPVLGFEYTHFSGDKTGTGDNEGWNPLLAQAPCWGEELLPIMLNGNWTNLDLFKVALKIQPLPQLKADLSFTDCYLDRTDKTTEHHHLGELISTNLSYKLNDNLSFAFQLSKFFAGNSFSRGHNGIWGRFETTLSF